MQKKIIEIEIIQSGQPRPYADHIYEAFFQIRSEGFLTNGACFYFIINEEFAKDITRLFVHDFKDNPDWYQPKLIKLEPVKPTEEM